MGRILIFPGTIVLSILNVPTLSTALADPPGVTSAFDPDHDTAKYRDISEGD